MDILHITKSCKVKTGYSVNDYSRFDSSKYRLGDYAHTLDDKHKTFRVRDKLILVVDYEEKDTKTGLPLRHVVSYARLHGRWLGFDKLHPNGATAEIFL